MTTEHARRLVAQYAPHAVKWRWDTPFAESVDTADAISMAWWPDQQVHAIEDLERIATGEAPSGWTRRRTA